MNDDLPVYNKQAIENLKLSERVFSDVLSPSLLSPCTSLHTRSLDFKQSLLCLLSYLFLTTQIINQIIGHFSEQKNNILSTYLYQQFKNLVQSLIAG